MNTDVKREALSVKRKSHFYSLNSYALLHAGLMRF
jgi:hypothetical protein